MRKDLYRQFSIRMKYEDTTLFSSIFLVIAFILVLWNVWLDNYPFLKKFYIKNSAT